MSIAVQMEDTTGSAFHSLEGKPIFYLVLDTSEHGNALITNLRELFPQISQFRDQFVAHGFSLILAAHGNSKSIGI